MGEVDEENDQETIELVGEWKAFFSHTLSPSPSPSPLPLPSPLSFQIATKIVDVQELHKYFDYAMPYEQLEEAIWQEASIMGMLSHPNIVYLVDCFAVGRIIYIGMEFVEGVSLLKHIPSQGSHIYTRARTHTLTHTHARARTHTLTHTRARTHTLTHTHARALIHTLIHTHARAQTQRLSYVGKQRNHSLTHTHTYTRTRTLTHSPTFTHLHTHSHILTHSHTHTYSRERAQACGRSRRECCFSNCAPPSRTATLEM